MREFGTYLSYAFIWLLCYNIVHAEYYHGLYCRAILQAVLAVLIVSSHSNGTDSM